MENGSIIHQVKSPLILNPLNQCRSLVDGINAHRMMAAGYECRLSADVTATE
ncbi:MAG: hypothetical protein GX422_09480 [Deltaproteobacteria bacterium]|nr:hypothetical protein [Deltaproteobacteria bacterium]